MNDSRGRHLALTSIILVLIGASATTTLAAPDPNGADSDFSMARHRFTFENGFRSQMWVDLPLFGRVNLASNSYGLCGGMIYAAHDSFWYESVSGRPTTSPRTSDGDVPEQGSRLRQYLWDRQLDSLNKDNWWAVRRLLDWMKKPLDDKRIAGRLVTKGLKSLSAEQFYSNIVPRIDKGWAVPLMLVNAKYGDKDAFTRNHQVLAIGYRLHDRPDGKREWDIKIYDPNCPNTFSYLHTRSRSNSCGKNYRGYFVTKYTGQAPYWADTGNSGKWTGPTPGGVTESGTLPDPFGTGDKGNDQPDTLPPKPRPINPR